MSEYQKAYTTMIEQNKDIFEKFQAIHDAFVMNPEVNKAKFNEVGREVTDIIRECDRKLCAQMGKGQFSKFTQNLSEKFWNEVRKRYPKIDFVGVQ